MTPLETTTRILRIDRRNIAFLKFVLEAYEGIAVLTTLERDSGTVRLAIAPGCEGEVAAVLNDLSPTIRMEPRETPAGAHGSVERSFAQPKRTR
ncbi:MAG: DUF4911 domain-containing protein [Desulfobacteraceae bacterium]|nr:DUF4911 domain-containing protein [Desulfobacteraceae bacterium]